MGKASSSKKVARAARTAGRPGAGRNFGWPALLSITVVVGIVLIVASRGGNEDARGPILSDHWHAAYAIYDCDHFVAPLNDVVEDRSGIHSHGDGLIHMHPFSTRYTGDGASLSAFGETTGLQISDSAVSAEGIDRENGDDCGSEPGTVQLKVWDGPDDTEGRIIEDDFGDYAPQEFEILTIAFVPEGADIPRPPEEVIDNLRAPADVPGAQTTTSLPTDGATTVPGEGTTVPENETTPPEDDTSETTTTTSESPPTTTP